MNDVTITPVRIPVAGANLEGILHRPRRLAAGPALAVCHAQWYDMDHPLLVGLCQELAQVGWVCLRFTWRFAAAGREPSPGLADEQQELAAAYAYLAEQPGVDPAARYLAGHSIGAWVASAVAAESEAAGVALWSYPLHSPDKSFFSPSDHWPRLRCPVLFVVADGDELCDWRELEPRCGAIPGTKTMAMLAGADHGLDGPAVAAVIETTEEWLRETWRKQ